MPAAWLAEQAPLCAAHNGGRRPFSPPKTYGGKHGVELNGQMSRRVACLVRVKRPFIHSVRPH